MVLYSTPAVAAVGLWASGLAGGALACAALAAHRENVKESHDTLLARSAAHTSMAARVKD